MQCEDPHLLVDRLGQTVKTQAKEEANDCPALPSRTWVITEKLDERAIIMDLEDIKLRSSRGFAAGKFLCYAIDDPAKTPAFMRIYAQLPIAGTEWSSPDIRRQQATEKSIKELMVLKRLKKMGCGVVPDLLGYQEDKQGPDDFVPDGYITYLVWQKVPGESLEYDKFWAMSFRSRKAIRAKFCELYPYVPATSVCRSLTNLYASFRELKRRGVLPIPTKISKIIYDPFTENMHFSGFRRAAIEEPSKGVDAADFAEFGLAKPSKEKDQWWLDTKGWEW